MSEAADVVTPKPDTKDEVVISEPKKQTKNRTKRKGKRKKNPVRDIIIYTVFMAFFSYSSLRGTFEADRFYYSNNIRGQFAEVEFLEKHSPTMGKTFEDIGTVEEWYQWMQGPLLAAAFSTHTFDGAAPVTEEANNTERVKAGYVLGQNRILGAVRISQLRGNQIECNDHVPEALSENYTWQCYGGKQGVFSTGVEDQSDFGDFREFDDDGNVIQSFGPFLFEGRSGKDGSPLNPCNGTFKAKSYFSMSKEDEDGEKTCISKVLTARRQFLSTFRTQRWNVYPSPSHAITIRPGIGETAANRIIQSIVRSDYIDLQTKAVFVDVTLYNPMLDRVANVRCVGEMTKAGGVMSSIEVQVVRMWEWQSWDMSSEDKIYLGVECIVGAFYLYYFWETCVGAWRVGSKFFSSFLNICQVLNFLFFCSQIGCRVYATRMVPTDVHVDSWEFIDFLPSTQFIIMATCIRATNCFLNWFKLINILSYDPQFGLMTDTLARSADGVAGFSMIFFIIFFGFAQAHAMIFHSRLDSFRTIGQTVYTLIRSLLGDFEFEELQDAHGYMGPLLFVIFVVLAVFVVLNMLIAIISDAYSESQEMMRKKKPVDLIGEIKDYMYVNWCCCFKACVDCRRRRRARRAEQRERRELEEAMKSGEVVPDGDAALFGVSPKAGKGAAVLFDLDDDDDDDEPHDPAMDETSQANSLLIEWFDQLKANEAEFELLQTEIGATTRNVQFMKGQFNSGMERMMTALEEACEATTTDSTELPPEQQHQHQQLGVGSSPAAGAASTAAANWASPETTGPPPL